MNSLSKEFIKYCKELISNAKTEDAIKILLNLDIDYNNEIAMVSNRWTALKRQRISDVVTEESYKIESNKISHSILLLLDEINNNLKVVKFNSENLISYKGKFEKITENDSTIDSIVLMNMFGSQWVVNECMAAVNIGDYHIDYITITGQSGMHDVNMIKIGNSQENIFSKNGQLNKKLSEEIEVLRKWKSWIRINREAFREFLSKNMISEYGARSISWGERFRASSNIFWGKRELFSNDENKYRVRLYEEENIQIIPFNRIGEVRKRGRNEWRNHP
jgi:phenolic acid decarboxylase